MTNQERWIVIARFGRPHGIKGFITVHSFTEPRDNVLQYVNWHVCIDNKWQPIKLLHTKAQNKSIIVQVEGYSDRDLAARLTQVEIAVQQDQLKKLEPGDYYWHQLLGMKVVNLQGESFGTVTGVIPTGAHDVLVVEGVKKHLIPYVLDYFILNIDVQHQLITVDWGMDF